MNSAIDNAILKVFVFKNGEYLGSEVFSGLKIVVGRDADVDLTLKSQTVSRRHAVIEHNGQQISVRDAGSSNGVFVNGKKIARALIGRRDEIVLGEYALKLQLLLRREEPDESAEPADESELTRQVRPETIRPSESGGAALHDTRALVAPNSVRASEPAPRPPASIAAADRESTPDPQQPRKGARGGTGAHDEAAAKPGLKARLFSRSTPAIARSTPKPVVQTPAERTTVDAAVVSASAPLFDLEKRLPIARQGAPAALPPLEHDDEDDEADFVPPFSLLERVVQDARAVPEALPHVEVLTLRDDRLLSIDVLRPGQSSYVSHPGARRFRAVRFTRAGLCKVSCPATVAHRISTGTRGPPPEAGRELRSTISDGETLELVVPPRRYLIRVTHCPVAPADPPPWRAPLRDRHLRRVAGSSVASHVAVLILGFILPASRLPPPSQVESFVEVALDNKLKLEEPPPPPPPAPEAPAPQLVPRRKGAVVRSATRPTAKSPGVLGLLSKAGRASAPGPLAAVASVSNLASANAPAGTSGFRVSGLIGNLPTSELRVGGGDGSVLATKGTAAIRGGAGRMAAKGSRNVEGLVQKMPQAMRSVGQGVLDRDAIQTVINQNIGQIQRCYERELVQHPGLSGKAEIEWTVAVNGSVRSARQKFSSINSVAVVNCILGAIRGWRFPTPKGGEVIVTYPFLFKSVNF